MPPEDDPAVTKSPGFPYRVEPLRTSHGRSAFHCGVPELDRYLHEQAGQDARRKVAAPFVLVDQQGSISGYYKLSACAIRLRELPEVTATSPVPASARNSARPAGDQQFVPWARPRAASLDACAAQELEEHTGGGFGRRCGRSLGRGCRGILSAR
jgi:hypothetical protein